MTNTALMFNIVPLMSERGLTTTDVAFFFSIFAIGLSAAQLLGGILADVMPLNILLSISMVALTGSMSLIWMGLAASTVPLFAALMGIGQALMMATNGPIWPRYFGRMHLGRIRGAQATVMVGASSVGPFILGVCFDQTGGYAAALGAFAILLTVMVVTALWATPPVSPRQIAESVEPALETGV